MTDTDTPHKIFIIEDESTLRESLQVLFESVQYEVEAFPNAQEFLKTYHSAMHGCLVTDIRLPGMSGLELLEQLNQQKSLVSVIIITGHGDIPMAVRAMKAGAVDFFLKPLNEQCILEAIQKCVCQSKNNLSVDLIKQKINSLSERERQITELILEGKLNKQIAYDLDISISTVESHRASVMNKMGAKNLAHLVKLYLEGSGSITAKW